jgi:hypothetical protein
MRWKKAFQFGSCGVLACLTLASVRWAASSSRVHAEPDAAPAGASHPSPLTPPIGDFDARAQRLFEAILHDAPEQASEVFFPRDAFLQVKAIPNPGRYYDKLYARFQQDIHALHRVLAKDAQFERFELAKPGGYVKPGEEGNHLPYWAARHCFLHYRERGQAKKLEVRVLITWQDRWYLIHLNEFH